MMAGSMGHVSVIAFVIDNGADIEAVDAERVKMYVSK